MQGCVTRQSAGSLGPLNTFAECEEYILLLSLFFNASFLEKRMANNIHMS